MRARTLVAACAAVGMALTLAACGSSVSSGSSSDTIHISMIVPTGTIGGNYPEELAGARAAVRAINAAGGVKGKKLEIDYCNEQLDVNQAAACARHAESSNSIALLGTNSTNSVQAVLPNIKTIPNIGPFSLNPDDTGCPTCYAYDSLMLGQLMSTQNLVQYANVKGKIQIVTLDIPAGHDSQGRNYNAMKQAGLDVMPNIYLPPTASDMSVYAQKIKDSGAAAVVPALANQGVFALLQAFKQINYKPVIFTNDTQVLPRDITALGSYIEGALFVISMPPSSAATDYPGVAKWVSDMKAEQAAGDADAASLNGVSLHAWLGVHAIAEIAGQINGKIDRASFTSALKSAKNIGLEGILPPWTPSAPTPANLPKGLQPYVFFGTVKGGKLVLLKKDPYNISTNQFQPVSGG